LVCACKLICSKRADFHPELLEIYDDLIIFFLFGVSVMKFLWVRFSIQSSAFIFYMLKQPRQVGKALHFPIGNVHQIGSPNNLALYLHRPEPQEVGVLFGKSL
jgi:hypothetical protein